MKKKMIPIAKPIISNDEIQAVAEVLNSGMLAQGKVVEEFENAFAEYIGVKNAIAVGNGTISLDIALKSLGIKQGDEVIAPSFTFISTANAVMTDIQAAIGIAQLKKLDRFNEKRIRNAEYHNQHIKVSPQPYLTRF